MTHTDALLMLAIIAASLLIAWAIEHLLQRRDYHRSLDVLATHGLFLPEDDPTWLEREAEWDFFGIAPQSDEVTAEQVARIELRLASLEAATDEELHALIDRETSA